MTMKGRLRSTNLRFFTVVAFLLLQVKGQEKHENHFTPVPLQDIIQDLRLLYLGSQSDYYISTHKADITTARQVCQNLTNMAGKKFQLLALETDKEAAEIAPHLTDLEFSRLWTGGEKSFDDHGVISLFWSTNQGLKSMAFKNFRQGLATRRRRNTETSNHTSDGSSETTLTNLLYPWLNVQKYSSGGKCRNGKFTPPQCEPVKCNVTMPECSTITPPCTVRNQTECSIERPPCSAKCENCTVTPPKCTATPKPCTVTARPCQTIRPECTVTTPPCVTKRPACETIQPPCEVVTPPPCTTPRPRCAPSFTNDNCTTVTYPCKTNKKNETICPEPTTVCEPGYKCPPPEICQSPAIICPPPLIYCEPETTVCPDPTIECKKPAIYCPQPEVYCPEPEVVCEAPQVTCDPPVVNCPGIVTNCPAPQLECPPPEVNCPPPVVACTKPEPCQPPEVTPPPCETEPTTTTTQKPCPGCGCIFMSKQHDFKWDIEACRSEYNFICEG